MASVTSIQPELPQGSRSLSILVADDSPMIRALISKLLSKRGLRVDLVCDGKAAVRAVQGNLYDMVLMNMQMPEMDGVTAAITIRNLSGPGNDSSRSLRSPPMRWSDKVKAVSPLA